MADSYSFPRSKLVLNNSEKISAVLISCGSFSPITRMHTHLMEAGKVALENEGGYTVIGGYISPVHDAYGKKSLIPSPYRVHMCKLATQESEWLMVDEWETVQEDYQRTIFALRHFQSELNHGTTVVKCFLICGMDMFYTLGNPDIWIQSEVEEIMSMGIVLVHRPDSGSLDGFCEKYPHLAKYRGNVIEVENYESISSTSVREKIRSGESIQSLVGDSVAEYIQSHRLYSSM